MHDPEFQRERRDAILLVALGSVIFAIGVLLLLGKSWPGGFGDWVRSWYTWKPFPIAVSSPRGNYRVGDVASFGSIGLGGGMVACVLWAWHQKYGF
ncbi:MAG: hypothetical protein SFX74_08430 [Fimbriimonadaceae bacterium]|nr:hypothetical protein [Fimbriimonadaceae bacterium]